MSLPVFIHPDLSRVEMGQQVTLEGAEARHAVTVKRLEPGERLKLIDGTGSIVEATVTATTGKDGLSAVADSVAQAREPQPRVVVVQAIPKSERAELAVDLATQSGADEIIAWQAERCVAKWADPKKAAKALAKWQASAVAAAKQSRRARIPQVHGPLSTAQLAQEISGSCAYVLHEEATASIRDVPLQGTVYILVGPEGGIGADELAKLPAQPIKLGPEVLRTASAAMVALAAIGMRTPRW
nr:16S rRNA (uracil(1498)-N(3))-methyltransferase [Corynebacterium sp. UBA5992]